MKSYGPVAPIKAVAPGNTPPDAPRTAGRGLASRISLLPGMPGAYSLSRWPGLESAFDFAEKAAKEALTGEHEYVWLADLGPEVRENPLPAIAAQVMPIVTLETDLWALRVNTKDFKVTPAGEVSYLGENKKGLDAVRHKVGQHHRLMVRLLASLGLDKVTNPTVRGCTWLVPWRVTKALEERTAIEIEAALVVAPAGAILQRGATIMLQNAWDLGAEDSDRFVSCLEGDPLLLSNQQRERWGIGMHLQGRVFWSVEPPEPEKRVKTPKKPKPQVPVELLREPTARVR